MVVCWQSGVVTGCKQFARVSIQQLLKQLLAAVCFAAI